MTESRSVLVLSITLVLIAAFTLGRAPASGDVALRPDSAAARGAATIASVDPNGHGRTDAVDLATAAAEIISDLENARQDAVPPGLLDRSQAVLIAPGLIASAQNDGILRGGGLLAIRSGDGSWSSPVEVSLAAATPGTTFERATALALLLTDSSSLTTWLATNRQPWEAPGPRDDESEGREERTLALTLHSDGVHALEYSDIGFSRAALESVRLRLDERSRAVIARAGLHPRPPVAGSGPVPALIRAFQETVASVAVDGGS